MSFDLKQYQASVLEEATVDIVHPVTGNPIGIRITVAAPESSKYKEVSMRVQNEQLQYIAKKGKPSAERVNANALNLLVGVTLRWEGITDDGEPIACTPENVRRIYDEVDFIREQVDEFLGDRRNFFTM